MFCRMLCLGLIFERVLSGTGTTDRISQKGIVFVVQLRRTSNMFSIL